MILSILMTVAAASASPTTYACSIEHAYAAAKTSGGWSVEDLELTDLLPGAMTFTVVDSDAHGDSHVTWSNSLFGINGQVQGAWSSGKFVFVADGDNCSFRSMPCVAMGELAPTSESDAEFSIVVAGKATYSDSKKPFLFQPMAFGSCKKAGA